ncbi:hypothetical protein PV11_04908 [Exophiala sideris]|uniref:Uncharacterized protein n=1 Tax=Exophiala sideris TaxID=1016849 RepID=A0A0D1W246_9EURO|nr:hypothetical protein PV11_04908 [Exophiala sideris]
MSRLYRSQGCVKSKNLCLFCHHRHTYKDSNYREVPSSRPRKIYIYPQNTRINPWEHHLHHTIITFSDHEDCGQTEGINKDQCILVRPELPKHDRSWDLGVLRD